MKIHGSAVERFCPGDVLPWRGSVVERFCRGEVLPWRDSKITAGEINDVTKVRVTSRCKQFCKNSVFPKNLTNRKRSSISRTFWTIKIALKLTLESGIDGEIGISGKCGNCGRFK